MPSISFISRLRHVLMLLIGSSPSPPPPHPPPHPVFLLNHFSACCIFLQELRNLPFGLPYRSLKTGHTSTSNEASGPVLRLLNPEPQPNLDPDLL